MANVQTATVLTTTFREEAEKSLRPLSHRQENCCQKNSRFLTSVNWKSGIRLLSDLICHFWTCAEFLESQTLKCYSSYDRVSSPPSALRQVLKTQINQFVMTKMTPSITICVNFFVWVSCKSHFFHSRFVLLTTDFLSFWCPGQRTSHCSWLQLLDPLFNNIK